MYPFPTLPKRLSSTIFTALCDELPPPTDETQDTRNNRDMAAMAAVAALGPIDMTEAMLAVRVVATDAHARDSLRLAGLNQGDLPAILRCRAQAASMMRQSQQAMRSLERLQAMRPIAPSAHDDDADARQEAQADPAEVATLGDTPDATRPGIAARSTKKPNAEWNEDDWPIPPNDLPGFAQLWLLPAHVTRNQKPYESHRSA